MKPGCSTALVLPRRLGIFVKQPGQELDPGSSHFHGLIMDISTVRSEIAAVRSGRGTCQNGPSSL